MRRGGLLTKSEAGGSGWEEVSGLKGNDVTRRELTGVWSLSLTELFSACAVPQHCFWISVCTSADGRWAEMFILGQWLEEKAPWNLSGFPLTCEVHVLYIGPLLLDASVWTQNSKCGHKCAGSPFILLGDTANWSHVSLLPRQTCHSDSFSQHTAVGINLYQLAWAASKWFAIPGLDNDTFKILRFGLHNSFSI